MELERQFAMLPKGGITKKRINGKEYSYYQWTEGGKQHSRLVKGQELETLSEQISLRKKLFSELKVSEGPSSFSSNVIVGGRLDALVESVKNLRKRSLYEDIRTYIYGDSFDKVLILYGLRRTGKTTLIRQVINEMSPNDRAKTAFIQVNSSNNLAQLNKDIRRLEELGFKYVFIDEVTLMEDFIEGASLFSDIYAACGMKIVLSGTDSLGFMFSEDEQLYDRCILLHTTFIPFREFYCVLGIKDIDEYIRFGGTMSRSGEKYNTSIFSSKSSTDEYVNTSIARNIQHSLKNYQHGGHFRNLQDLYEKNELTNVINRIVEDINHRFTIDVLTRDFKSHDFGSAKDILRKDRSNPTDVLDDVDEEELTRNLMKMLEVLNKDQQSIEIKDCHRSDIREYLLLLDLICDIPVVNMNDLNCENSLTVFTQPGLRYSQAESLVKALLMDESFRNISAQDRFALVSRILEEVRGRMLEEIVLLETKKANPDLQVFKLQFAVGEFDMVVYDPEKCCCSIYEIKHSAEVVPAQYRHLVNEQKCSQVEFRYGTINKKVVLYRGKNTRVEEVGVDYINVEQYLTSLS